MPADPVDVAFDEFCEAWFSGQRIDPETYCRDHPECGPELGERIESFLLVNRELPRVGHGKKNPTDRPGERQADGQTNLPGDGLALGSPLVPGKCIGDFRIVREIGRGGMGVVYEAEQVSLKRKVAFKVLQPHFSFSDETIKKFHREAEAGGRQSHPGIVAVHAVGEHEGIHFIAQDLVEGGITLADKLEELRKEGELPVGYFRQAAEWIAEVGEALAHTHGKGVIHRDIKPSNILIGEDGRCKVTDFGLAKVEDALVLSRSGDFSGTPYYMSPEQTDRKRGFIDPRSDIFSLGVTLFEALTLKRPFEGESTQEILKGILFDDPQDPSRINPRVPRDLAVICLTAMEKAPEKRYQTMDELSGDLRRYLSGEVILAKSASVKTRLWKWARRNPALSAAGGAALLAVLCFVGYVQFWSYPRIKEQYEEIVRLADINLLNDLKAKADAFWPIVPEKAPEMATWLDQARELKERLPIHRATLENIRAEAIESQPFESGTIKSKPTTWRFKDRETQWQHEGFQDLVEGIEELFDEETGLFEQMAERHAFASNVWQRSIGDRRKAWDEAVASIADERACPKYKELHIKPVIGLVPLGQDPDSGLWEFAHLQTGEIPKRDDGRLVLTEEMGLVFVLIPGGSFIMGAQTEDPDGPNYDPNARPDEYPPHEVDVEPFLFSKYEMTQGQWLRFTGYNKSKFHPGTELVNIEVTLLHPVEFVSWEDCVAELNRLSLRLPTEAEWEYAARAGTTTPWWTGDDKESLAGTANIRDQSHHSVFSSDSRLYEEWLNDGYAVHAPVGSYKPNPFGLHDMCGNEPEFCLDSASVDYKSTSTDGTAYISPDSDMKITRGGAYTSHAPMCRHAVRMRIRRSMRYADSGFRPALSLK